jgi:hypothetical protein
VANSEDTEQNVQRPHEVSDKVKYYDPIIKVRADTKASYKYLFVAARNSSVTSQLQKTYAGEFEPERVPVFCVDNMDYQNPDFTLDINATGIPQLRHFCYSVPAKALFRSAHNFLENLLPSLIQSVRLWYQTNGLESKSISISELLNGDDIHLVWIS